MAGAELGRGLPGDAVRRRLLAAAVTAAFVADVHHAAERVAGAELGLLGAVGVAVRRSDGAAAHAAALVADVHHAGEGVARAELGLLAVLLAVGRPGVAALVVAALAAHVDHALLGMPRAELGLMGDEFAAIGNRFRAGYCKLAVLPEGEIGVPYDKSLRGLLKRVDRWTQNKRGLDRTPDRYNTYTKGVVQNLCMGHVGLGGMHNKWYVSHFQLVCRE